MPVRNVIRIAFTICLALGVKPGVGADIEEIFERTDQWLSADASSVAEQERENEPIETDRDSFTPATTTVSRGRTIFESSYSFIENPIADDTHSFPEIITRIGMTERLEFRLGWNYEVGGGGSVSGGDAGGDIESTTAEEESQMLYGFKIGLTKQRGLIPRSACIVQSTVPTSGPDNFQDLQLGYVFGWRFFDDWQLDSCIRCLNTREERDHFNDWAPSVVLKVHVHERWNIHSEYFGRFSDGREEGRTHHYFSPGVHYLVTRNCEIGLRLGWGLNEQSATFFSNLGLGLQF